MESLSCAFTGYRPSRFAWGDREDDPRCAALRQRLYGEIEGLIRGGVRRFYSGMALGVDLWAAESVLCLSQRYPGAQLYAAVPFPGQEARWPAAEQERYRAILRRCAGVATVSRQYTRDCYLERNRWMVEHADLLFAVCNPAVLQRTGTMSTVRYARGRGRPVLLLHPDTLAMTWEGAAPLPTGDAP